MTDPIEINRWNWDEQAIIRARDTPEFMPLIACSSARIGCILSVALAGRDRSALAFRAPLHDADVAVF
jgi:hypothetical protein